MSCCEDTEDAERSSDVGCCGSHCVKRSNSGCCASQSRIRFCSCQDNVGCPVRVDCAGFCSTGSPTADVCPEPCQCVEEEIWNSNAPPKPTCEWFNNFNELRRQWSDHARRQSCRCCKCKGCKTSAPCLRPCLPATPRCPSTTPPADCQECCEERRLAGGANDVPEQFQVTTSIAADTSKRESGGGCPPPSCHRSTTRRRSPSTEYSSSSSFRCPAPVRCQNHPSVRGPACGSSSNRRPCSPPPKSILKKRSCCQCGTVYCTCQPMHRSCNCPPPIQVDARADKEWICDCPSVSDISCPQVERRSPGAVNCSNFRHRCPSSRPSTPNCCCAECQPCLPEPCDCCSSKRYRSSVPTPEPCRSRSPCSSFSPRRPGTADSNSFCREVVTCSQCREVERDRREREVYCDSRDSQLRRCCRSHSPCRGTGQSSSWSDLQQYAGNGGGNEDAEAEYCTGGGVCRMESDYCTHYSQCYETDEESDENRYDFCTSGCSNETTAVPCSKQNCNKVEFVKVADSVPAEASPEVHFEVTSSSEIPSIEKLNGKDSVLEEVPLNTSPKNDASDRTEVDEVPAGTFSAASTSSSTTPANGADKQKQPEMDRIIRPSPISSIRRHVAKPQLRFLSSDVKDRSVSTTARPTAATLLLQRQRQSAPQQKEN